MNMNLSVCLATFNEEEHIKDLISSVRTIADEIIVVDGSSTDKTASIAQKMGATVVVTDNPRIFHINKQKAMDMAKGEWILQMDADERISPALAAEITHVITMNQQEIEQYQAQLPLKNLFLRHQQLIDERDGQVGKRTGEYVAFYIPRKNYFLGRFLRYGGVYPDGVIRLIRRGKAYLPSKDVHEQMVVNGKVGWLQNDILHYDSPTFKRYIARNNRYIALITDEMKQSRLPKSPVNFITYMCIKPVSWFIMTQLRHKGILDGWQGVVFSFFSALRFPRAYLRYITT